MDDLRVDSNQGNRGPDQRRKPPASTVDPVPSGGPEDARSVEPRLLDRVRGAIRARHYSARTERAYVGWIKRYIFFHQKRNPAEMGAIQVGQFLSALGRSGRVSASTQNRIRPSARCCFFTERCSATS
jgi:hypothetical protein